MAEPEGQFIASGEQRLRWLRRESRRGPVAVVCGGLLSDQLQTDSRGALVDLICDEFGMGCIRFNYTAHGETALTQSSGTFAELTIAQMINDAVAASLRASSKKILLVGSSVGGGIAPFVASRLSSEGLNVVGVFTTSAVPPKSLRDFVLAQVASVDRPAFDAGQSITVTSSTLPVPIQVRKEQVEGTERYDLDKIVPLPIHSRLIFGAKDPLSKRAYNVELARSFGQNDDAVVETPDGHEIDFAVMAGQLRSFLSAERLAD